MLSEGVGVPVVVTVKENGTASMAVAAAALVKLGAVPPSSAKAGALERPLKAKRPAPRASAAMTTGQLPHGWTAFRSTRDD